MSQRELPDNSSNNQTATKPIGQLEYPGYHVNGWGAIVRGYGPWADQVSQMFYSRIMDLHLQQVTVTVEKVRLAGVFSELRKHYVVRKRLDKGIRGAATLTLVRINGNEQRDLEIAWFLFERDSLQPFYWGAAAFLAWAISLLYISSASTALFRDTSLLIGMIGLAVYLSGRAAGFWGRLYSRSPLSPYERFDSSVLARYVDTVLKSLLDEMNIDSSEIHELNFTEESWIEKRRFKISK